MNVKKIVEDKDLKTWELASDLGISCTHAHNLIVGKFKPSMRLCQKIRKTYNIPLASI
jgi:DNA-binding XRE family transcriptional regulator|tara:strand:+ start:6756 stop:6929 length:174 start_codon:yes stop_codon:yes gene_type:complete